MKKTSYFLPLILLVPILMGMGTGGGSVSEKIPSVDKNYSATITDTEGVITKVTNISFDGRTYLSGHRGSSTVSIPFEKIKFIQVNRVNGEKAVNALIGFKSGSSLNIKVEGNTPCYGSAEFGNVHVEFRELKKVEMEGLVQKDQR